MNHQAIRKFFILSQIQQIKRTIKSKTCSVAKRMIALRDLTCAQRALDTIEGRNRPERFNSI